MTLPHNVGLIFEGSESTASTKDLRFRPLCGRLTPSTSEESPWISA